MYDVLQVLGALGILIPFALAQFGRMSPSSVPYLVLNLLGSGLLGVQALDGEQWGFVLLEVAWAGVAAWSLLRLATGRPVPTAD